MALAFKWLLIALSVVRAAGIAASVGKPRPEITHDGAFWNVILSAFFIAGLLYFWR